MNRPAGGPALVYVLVATNKDLPMRQLILATILTTTACATDVTSPEISDLTATPSTMKVGQQATVGGTLVFADPDGDLEQLTGEITLPDGTQRALAKTDLAGVGSMTDGTLAWQMIVVPPMAGSYTLSLWLIDAAGNESNRLETVATATP